MMRSDEEILEIWEKSGLMDGVKKSQRSHISKCLEDCANYMLERIQISKRQVAGISYAQDDRVKTLMLPFIRKYFSRLVEEGYRAKDIHEKIDYEDIFLTLREAIENVDYEAELLCLVVNVYVNKKEKNI